MPRLVGHIVAEGFIIITMCFVFYDFQTYTNMFASSCMSAATARRQPTFPAGTNSATIVTSSKRGKLYQRIHCNQRS